MADDDALLAKLVDVGPQAQAQGLDAEEVDLGAEQPAGVILAKAGGLHEGQVLVVGGLRDEISAGEGQHRRSSSIPPRSYAFRPAAASAGGSHHPGAKQVVDMQDAHRPASVEDEEHVHRRGWVGHQGQGL